MVQEFSSFAKLPEVQLSPDDVAPLLDELTTLCRTSHSSVMWDLHLPERVPKIALDPAALHRALLNIFTNAAEALDTLPPEATKRVRITAVHDRGRGSLRLIISDNGPGLQPEERERMFEPYFSRKKGGTGLGLAIVKSIIADHRGTCLLYTSHLERLRPVFQVCGRKQPFGVCTSAIGARRTGFIGADHVFKLARAGRAIKIVHRHKGITPF